MVLPWPNCRDKECHHGGSQRQQQPPIAMRSRLAPRCHPAEEPGARRYEHQHSGCRDRRETVCSLAREKGIELDRCGVWRTRVWSGRFPSCKRFEVCRFQDVWMSGFPCCPRFKVVRVQECFEFDVGNDPQLAPKIGRTCHQNPGREAKQWKQNQKYQRTAALQSRWINTLSHVLPQAYRRITYILLYHRATKRVDLIEKYFRQHQAHVRPYPLSSPSGSSLRHRRRPGSPARCRRLRCSR